MRWVIEVSPALLMAQAAQDCGMNGALQRSPNANSPVAGGSPGLGHGMEPCKEVGLQTHPPLLAQAAKDCGVDGSHAPVHIGVVHFGDEVLLGSPTQVVLQAAAPRPVSHI